MKGKALNLKNMKETLVNYSGTQEEMNKIWDGLHQMACLGFIDRDLWQRFYNECKGWTIAGDKVIDTASNDKLIYTYSMDETYKA